jgi:uroporphyrinogen-III synthase
MVTQSRAKPVPLLLTRPGAQGASFADDLRARFGDQLRVINTPLMAPRFFAPALPAGPFVALIITSQTGVEAYARLGKTTQGLPREVFCVGQRTASAAMDAQLSPVLVAQDAADLIGQIKALRPDGKLLHLRGRDARGDVRYHLNSAGIDTDEAVIYRQEQQPLTPQAGAVLHEASAVLAPLFSARTAAIFAAEVQRIGGISPLFVAAISGEVALELTAISPQVKVASTPDAASMLDAVALLLVDIGRA